VKVQVQCPRTEVTLEQVRRWLSSNGFARAHVRIDCEAWQHGEYMEGVLVPLPGCLEEERRTENVIEGVAGILGRHAVDILREMAEVVV
jgi:hypothetical protein